VVPHSCKSRLLMQMARGSGKPPAFWSSKVDFTPLRLLRPNWKLLMTPPAHTVVVVDVRVAVEDVFEVAVDVVVVYVLVTDVVDVLV
jgi:hypothetical protein